MNVSPWILGAAALVPIAGAVAGTKMSTDLIGVHADVTASLPEASSGITAAPPIARERLPDHYAMETPEGRIEVAELAWYGRFRDQARYYRSAWEDGYDLDAELDRMEVRWNLEDSTSRAAAALDARQPDMVRARPSARYAEAPHYAALEKQRTGEDPRTTDVGVVEIAPEVEAEPVAERVASLEIEVPGPRVVDVSDELGLQD